MIYSVTVSDTTQGDADNTDDTGSDTSESSKPDSDTVPDDGQSHQVSTIDSSDFIGIVYKTKMPLLALPLNYKIPMKTASLPRFF